MREYQILHDLVRVRKCYRDHVRNADGSVLIYRPEDSRAEDTSQAVWLNSTDHTNWAEIIDFGPKCKYINKELIGYRVLCPEQMQRLVQDDFLIHEDQLKFAVEPAGERNAQ